MANIVIKEILAADTISNLVDKINFNFDQLLLNGGGPLGMTGSSGPLGPIGPRGSLWFTLRDIYNTSLTTTSAPPKLFPMWNGTAQQVNITTNAGYPQFKGDPNKYKPVATAISPNTYPEYSFTIGNTGKLPRSGDYYLQEGDDSFNGQSSFDGDVWEFNSISSTWTFTGVNIKGNAGATGASGATDWLRTFDSSLTVRDILRPKSTTGNNQVVRMLFGKNNTNVATEPAGNIYTNNLLTLYQDTVNANGYQIALTDVTSVTSDVDSVPTSDYAKIGTRNNILYIQGFGDTTQTGANWGRSVEVVARQGYASMLSTYQYGGNTSVNNYAVIDAKYRYFQVTNADLHVVVDPTQPKNGTTPARVEHLFTTQGLENVGLSIIHNQSSSIGGWAEKSMILNAYGDRTNSYTPTRVDIILQGKDSSGSITADDIANVGIGAWTTGRPTGKLSITRGQYRNTTTPFGFAALAIGDTWSRSNATYTPAIQTINTGFNFSKFPNSAFIEGAVVVGGGTNATNSDLGSPKVYGVSSMSVNGDITMTNSTMIGFNAYTDIGDNNVWYLKAAYGASTGTTSRVPYFVGQLDASLYNANGAVSIQPDLFGKFGIGGSSSYPASRGANTTGNLHGAVPFNINLSIDSPANKVGIHTVFLQNDFNVAGGAIIGKIKSFTAGTLFGHVDAQANKNVIIGYPQGAVSESPRIDVSNSASSPAQTTYITTPVWSGSMNFIATTGGAGSQSVATTRPFSSVYDDNTGTIIINRWALSAHYLPSANSQNKIVHGHVVTNTVSGGTRLLAASNPYDTGVGLEIESRLWAYLPAGTRLINRSPILLQNGSTALKGNRPMLITRAYETNNTLLDTLFEISPFGNTSVGGSFPYPRYSIFDINYDVATGNRLAYSTPSGSTVTSLGTATLTNLVNASNWFSSLLAGTNTSINQYGYASFILPSGDRSLHINSIVSNNSLNQFDDTYALDQNFNKIRAGVVIDTPNYYSTAAINAATTTINGYFGFDYYNFLTRHNGVIFAGQNYGFYRPQITTPMKAAVVTSTATNRFVLATMSPLSMKPGLFSYIYDGPSNAYKTRLAKGADVMISGGDVLYSGNNALPLDSIKAGDVFIYGGNVYSDAIGGNSSGSVNGYQKAVTEINASSYSSIEKRNIGNIFIGSRPDANAVNGYYSSAAGVIKSGLVYVGYQGSDAASWNSSTSTFSPKGRAALNVTAVPDDNSRESDGIKSGNRAINIQRGDIVTKDEEAGWIIIDLSQSPYVTTENININTTNNGSTYQGYINNVRRSNILGVVNNNNVAITYAYFLGGGVGYGTAPIFRVKYKVIGYTVFYKFEFLGATFKTLVSVDSSLSGWGSELIINLNNVMYNLSGNMYGMPPLKRTAAPTEAKVYASYSQQMTYPHLPYGMAVNHTFSARGSLVLRNAPYEYGNSKVYPYTANGIQNYNLPLEFIELRGAYNDRNANSVGSSVNAIQLGKASGSVYPSWLVPPSGSTNPGEWYSQAINAAKLLPMGNYWLGNTPVGYTGALLFQADIIVEGTYELDPALWFN